MGDTKEGAAAGEAKPSEGGSSHPEEGEEDSGPVLSPVDSLDLLHRTEEEEEIEAKGINTSAELDEDFLIMDEAKDDSEDDEQASGDEKDGGDSQEPAETSVSEAPARTSTPKPGDSGSNSASTDSASEKGDAAGDVEPAETTQPAEKMDTGNDSEQADASQDKDEPEAEDEAEVETSPPSKPEASGEVVGKGGEGDGKVEVEEDDEKMDCTEESEPEKVEASVDEPSVANEEEVEADKTLDTSDDVQVIAIEKPADKKPEVKSSQAEDCSSEKENKVPVLNGAGNAGTVSSMKDDSDAADTDSDSKPPKRLGSAAGYASFSDLKRALNMLDSEPGTPKRFKFDGEDDCDVKPDVASVGGGGDATDAAAAAAESVVVGDGPPPVGMSLGSNLVVLSRRQLEQYVTKRVRACLSAQATALLQPMEKKCDTLHRALERWRRRSFQLQKQFNDFVCEQERCANARKARRSVGVCVRMPPMKQPAPPTPTVAARATMATTPSGMSVATVARSSPSAVAVSTMATSPVRVPQSQAQQLRVTGTNATMLAAQLGLKPNQHMKLLSVPTPGGGTTTAVMRMPPQLQSAPTPPSPNSNVPVPMQLIANTANAAAQSPQLAKPINLPVSAVSTPSPVGTPIRTVTMVSSAAGNSATSPSAVKFIDLTQEEEAGHKVISVSMAGGGIQKISVPSSGIPVLSAAPTSLVQMPPTSSLPPAMTRVSISGTSVVFTPATGTVTSAAAPVRLGGQPQAQPQPMGPRVTYLVPSLPPGMIVTPREAGPRLGPGGTTQPMQTILLRMASPQGGFTTVPGSAIAMSNLMPANASGSPSGAPGTTMMVATAGGNQVRMIRGPPPMALPRGGTTLTLPPGTTLVRGPPAAGMRPGVPQQQQQISVVRPPVSSVSTPTQTTAPPLTKPPTVHVQVPGYPPTPVSGTVTKVAESRPPPALQAPPTKPDTAGSLINKGPQHPAALPPTPRYIDDPKKKRLPPKPALKITKASSAAADNAAQPATKKMTLFPRREPKKQRAAPSTAEPKPQQPTVVDMEMVLEQWQTYLDTGTVGSMNDDKSDKTGGRRSRLPYHAQRPLRLACLCRLGTCRYDKLPAAYKERLHADFGRLEPSRQLRALLARMHTEGKAKHGGTAQRRANAAWKGRCKWVYWLPATLGAATTGQGRRKVCKAGFMAVHGITEKRTRDVQLLWMRLKAKRGRTPTGQESDIEQEELMPGAYTDVEDDDEEGKVADVPSKSKAKPKPRQPNRGRKVLKTSSDSEESSGSESGGPASFGKKEAPDDKKDAEETCKETKDVESKTSQNDEETEVEGDDEADDDDDVPYVDITGFEPICSLEEDSRNLVLSLPRGVFGEDGDDATVEET
ncbi:uncharacterized protein LOC144138088 isoform X2 [Haemaphysalis longicornis]